MVVKQRASTIEGIKECVLCTDWTGNHDKSNCKARIRGALLPNCPFSEKGILCDRKHHIMLRGATLGRVDFWQKWKDKKGGCLKYAFNFSEHENMF